MSYGEPVKNSGKCKKLSKAEIESYISSSCALFDNILSGNCEGIPLKKMISIIANTHPMSMPSWPRMPTGELHYDAEYNPKDRYAVHSLKA